MKKRIRPLMLIGVLLFLIACTTMQQTEEEENTIEETQRAVEENLSQKEEISEIISEEEELSPEEQAWEERIDAALAPSYCFAVEGPSYGEEYYTGPLIDTHYHIANIPDSNPLDDEEEDTDKLLLGVNIKISDMVCTIEQEGTAKVFAFFPVYLEIPEQMVEVVSRTMKEYPDKFVPFIMAPEHDDDPEGFPTVDAAELEEMLAISPSLFEGYGEIGLYAREGGGAKELPPDAERFLEIYPLVRENSLIVYFHLGQGQQEAFGKVAQDNPDISFIWHGDQLINIDGGGQDFDVLEEILSKHPNVYYGIDELYGDELMIHPDKSKAELLAHLENYETLLREDWATWKALIERYPDQFLWGTDRSDQVLWSYDPEVGIALTNYARAFTAGLDEEVQDKFAYKNAEKLLE